MFRPHWVCPAHRCLCFPRLHCSGSQLLYVERALRRVRFQFSGPPQKRGFGCACVLCLPRPEQLWQQGAWAHSTRCGSPFPSAAPVRTGGVPEVCVCSQELASSRDPPGGDHPESQEVFRQDPGPVCRVGGGGFSGLSLPLAPPPCLLPPVGMGRLFSGVSQSLCFANGRQCVQAG